MQPIDIPDFRNKAIKYLIPYTPGEQSDSKNLIKLNTNEFPFPPSPNVRKELNRIASDYSILRKYPHPFSEPLRKTLALKYRVDPEEILVTNGSDEAISLICRAFLEQGDMATFSEVTYTLYEVLIKIGGGIPIKAKAKTKNGSPFCIDLDALEDTDAKVVFLANPNAITGEYTELDPLEDILSKSKKLWVLDEAYIDFHARKEKASFLEKWKRQQNVIVLKTFSKSYGLAGMRVGYAISKNKMIMKALYSIKDSYNQDRIAIRTSIAAMDDVEYYSEKISIIIQERKKLMKILSDMGYELIDSSTNFLLVKPVTEKAEDVYKKLKEKNILVRYFKDSAISEYLRITIGTPNENKTLINALMDHPLRVR